MKTKKPNLEQVVAFNHQFVRVIQEKRAEALKELDDLFLKASIFHKAHAQKVQ